MAPHFFVRFKTIEAVFLLTKHLSRLGRCLTRESSQKKLTFISLVFTDFVC